MSFIKKFLANTRKPQGFLGKIMVNGMNRGHARCADWGMDQLKDVSAKTILDCGCGGGRNIAALLSRFPDSVAWGLDYSEISVEKTRKVNAKTIADGRCIVQKGDVAALPFAESSFDLVTAFETVYFWPGLESCFRQVFRVLNPGGSFLILNESDGTDPAGEKWQEMIEGMSLYKEKDLADTLKAAGFVDIQISRYVQKHWLAVIGKKP